MTRTVEIELNGITPFRLLVDDLNDRVIAPYMARHGCWEPMQTELATRLVNPGHHAVDIGAHVGYYAVLLSRLVGPDGLVHAFEPEPVNFGLLQQNLVRNRADNVHASPCAITDRAGEESLYLSDTNGGDHQLFPSHGRAACRVATDTLDLYVQSRPMVVDFIKMDIQGTESRALAGMAGVIGDNRGRLACLAEFDPVRLARSGVTMCGFLAQLAALDARVDWVDLHHRSVRLTRLRDIHELRGAAKQLALRGEDGCLLLCFSDRAREAAFDRITSPAHRDAPMPAR